MKEYLKMADVFDDIVNVSSVYGHILYTGDIEDDGSIEEHAAAFNETSAKYLAHAINSHDELVAEVERLSSSLNHANSNHELFERQYYLEKDEVDGLQLEVEKLQQEVERLSSLMLERTQEPGPY